MLCEKRSTGNALNQYAILLGLIAFAIIPTIVIYGKQITDTLSSYIGQYTGMNSAMQTNMDAMSSKTATGTNNLNMAANEKCSNDTCDIDFGSLVLKAVPNNFEKLVETSGASGGTEELLKLLQQLADQKAAEGNLEEAKKISNLIDRGREIMQLERVFDDWFAKNGNSVDAYSQYYEQYLDKVNELRQSYGVTCSNTTNVEQGTYSSYVGTSGSNTVKGRVCTFKSAEDEAAYNKDVNAAYANLVTARLPELTATFTTQSSITINGQTIKANNLPLNLMYFLNPTAVIHIDDTGAIDFKGYGTSFDTTSASNFNDMLNGKITYDTYKNPPGLPQALYDQGVFTTSPVGYYLDELKTLAATTKDTTVLNITTQLSDEIYKLAARVSEKTNNVLGVLRDPKNREDYNYTQPTNAVVKTTRLDLAVICASNGGDYNSDETCK